MGNGPVMSIEVMHVLYGVLHSMKGDTFIRQLMQRAVEATGFQFEQANSHADEIYRLSCENEGLRKLLNKPVDAWNDRDLKLAASKAL